MAARHLPRLITLINTIWFFTHQKPPAGTRDYVFRIPIVKVIFDFNTSSMYYGKHAPWRAEALATLSKGLQKFGFCYTYDVYDASDPPPPNVDYSREIVVRGLSLEKSRKLTEASNLPPMTTGNCIQEAQRIKEEGDRLVRQGFYTDAVSNYQLSAFLITDNSFPGSNWGPWRTCPTLKMILALIGAWLGDLGMLQKLNLSRERADFDMMLRQYFKACLSPWEYAWKDYNTILDAYSVDLLQNDFFAIFAIVYRIAKDTYPGFRGSKSCMRKLLTYGRELRREILWN